MKFKVLESILTEGTHYDKDAAKIIADSGLYDLETSQKIIDGLRKEDIHAFVHAPNWLMKYLKGIARMLVDYSQGNRDRAVSFLTDNIDLFNDTLTWIKQNREKKNLDNEFVNKWSLQDVKDFYDEVEKAADKESNKELSKMNFNNSSSYKLIPIESFEEFNSKFGGRLTGDGLSDKYAGGGGTAWCHANSKPTYDNWVKNNTYKFFVLANNDFKNIPPNKTKDNPKDDYGNSLIAILVNKQTGRLKNATLRWNHVGVNSNPDNQYTTYAELSRVAGFNVEEEIKKYLGDTIVSLDNYIYTGGQVPEDIREEITKVTISDSVTRIFYQAFSRCKGLTSITIPDSVTSIGSYAFEGCSNLISITIPNSVTTIGKGAFAGCANLRSITIPDSVTYIDNYTFRGCMGLTNITIPESVTTIGSYAFANCTNLESITIPDSVTTIGRSAFYVCTSLKNITIPSSVTTIPFWIFAGCSRLTNISIPNSVTTIGDGAFSYCTRLTNITIPNNITHIGWGALMGCANLKSITIPSSVTSIDEDVFKDCSSDLVFYCEKGLRPEIVDELKKYGKVEINESIKNIFKFILLENIDK